MLALSAPHNRAIVDEAEMIEIGSWDTIQSGENLGWMKKHRYSNIEVPCDAPPAPNYQTPSPGNRAAIEAAVGMLADPDIEIHPDQRFDSP